MPSTRSMKGTMTSTFSATVTPRVTPSRLPSRPTSVPCTMKIFMIERGEAPRVRRMAMSDCLSLTVITRVETRLKAATAMIIARIMNIMRFCDCTAANQTVFTCDQSRSTSSALQAAPQLGRHLRRLVHVAQAQAQAGRALDARGSDGVVEVGEGQRRIEFVMAGFEDADHGEGLGARRDRGAIAGAACAAQQHGHALADRHLQRLGQRAAEHDVHRAGGEFVEAALAHLARHFRDLRFLGRQDPAQQGRFHDAVAQQHALHVGEGRGGRHLRIARGLARDGAPVGHEAARVVDFDVGQHRQHAVGDFFLKTVHHRQHDDQGRDAERDAGHGDHRNEGNEAVAAAAFAGARVAQADQRFVRQLVDDAHNF